MNLLLKDVDIGGINWDVRCRASRVVQISPNLPVSPNEQCLYADGGALIPGLQDHHLHLFSTAASKLSVALGPPTVFDVSGLVESLRNAPGEEWIRGVGYHESVAGDLIAEQIDQWVADRPVRIQHRSGRL